MDKNRNLHPVTLAFGFDKNQHKIKTFFYYSYENIVFYLKILLLKHSFWYNHLISYSNMTGRTFNFHLFIPILNCVILQISKMWMSLGLKRERVKWRIALCELLYTRVFFRVQDIMIITITLKGSPKRTRKWQHLKVYALYKAGIIISGRESRG